MAESYDAIVIGARCGGAPTAMLLARRGYRVLLVDRATFPSDTVSTHFIHAPGMAALQRWGLRDALAATGCPAIRTYSFDFGPFTIEGSPRAVDGVDEAYCPRRPVLDTMLVHAAADAGAEVREAFTVDDILIEDGTVIGVRGKEAGGATVTEHAKVVIGADGRNSSVVKAVKPEQYNEKPAVTPAFYSYWSGVGSSGFEVSVRDRCGMAAFPTHDNLTLVIVGLPEDDFNAARSDVEGTFLRTVDLAAALGDRCDQDSVRSGSTPRPTSPGTSASPTDLAGRSSATPATTCIRSPPRASPTRSWTPSGSPTRSTPRSPNAAPTTTPWPHTRPPATNRRCRCTR